MQRALFMMAAIFFMALPQAPVNAEKNNETLREKIERIDANVVLMRHALAPGNGDPEYFDINDCATQRNLDDEGRAQAAAIGNKLKMEKIIFTEILSSQWCRCKETATFLKLGKWQEFAGLNSFFQGFAHKEKTLALLSQKLDRVGRDELILMVTHQVIMTELTGIFPHSGELIFYNTRTEETTR